MTTLTLLRKFRDRAVKKEYVDLYYKYNPLVTTIFMENPLLLWQASHLIIKYLPMLESTIEKQDIFMTEENITDIVSFIENIENKCYEIDEVKNKNIIEFITFLEDFKDEIKKSANQSFARGFVKYLKDDYDQKNVNQGCSSCSCTYSNSDCSACSNATCSDKCSNGEIYKIDAWGQVSSDLIKNKLIAIGPLSVAMGIGDSVSGAFDNNGIYKCQDDNTVNHAVVIVGYDDNKAAWIVRNSWGQDWEEGGYFYVGYGECAIESYVYYAYISAPDLAETSVSNPPASAVDGGSFSVTDTVKNQGNATAGASTTRYYLSIDTTKGARDILLTGSRAVSSLAAGATSTGTVTVKVPSMATGSYYLLACADDTGVVAEGNEANNCKTSTSKVVISAATLIITSPNGGE